MNEMLLPRRKEMSLRFGIYHLMNELTTSMRYGMVVSLRYHGGRDRSLCPHLYEVISIHLLLHAPILENYEKGSNPLSEGRCREWMWL
jgi:hypothetical protein